MVIFGLLLLLAGVILLLLGFFTSDMDIDEDNPSSTTVELMRGNLDPEWLFVFGVVAGVLIVLGLWVMKSGTQRSWKRRKEEKRLNELNEKLSRVEAERRREEGEESV
jgi:cell division protein FtsB